MSRRMTFLAVALLGSALVACGANGGDPVARRQIPAADPGGSGSDGGGSDGGGSDGADAGSGDDHARKVGLPKSIRIPEIGQQAFEEGVAAACGSKDGAPDCLTVRYETVQDPDHGCGFEWESDPPKESAGDGTASTVQRGATLTATIFTCPADSPAPDDGSTSDDPATTMDPATGTPTP
jgi:hypothetical protein